jgi:hypothetical protein
MWYENGLVLYSVTSEVTSGLRLYPSSYELRVTRTSGFRCENIELWEKVWSVILITTRHPSWDGTYLTVGFSQVQVVHKLYDWPTKHDGVREKLRGFDYGDLRLKRRVVHSVPYLTIRANRIPKPDFRKAFGKASSWSDSQYNNFNSFNGLSSDSLCCIIPQPGISLRPLGYSVYSLLYLLCHLLTTLLFSCQEIEFNNSADGGCHTSNKQSDACRQQKITTLIAHHWLKSLEHQERSGSYSEMVPHIKIVLAAVARKALLVAFSTSTRCSFMALVSQLIG